MAKKKDFSKVVEESFEEGYRSEPENPSSEPTKHNELVEELPAAVVVENLTENELLLQKIVSGDKDALRDLWDREDRSTYYLTDLHRACVDVMSHEEGIKKNEVVVAALNQFFSEDVITTARELVVSRAIKKLEKEIKEENK